MAADANCKSLFTFSWKVLGGWQCLEWRVKNENKATWGVRTILWGDILLHLSAESTSSPFWMRHECPSICSPRKNGNLTHTLPLMLLIWGQILLSPTLVEIHPSQWHYSGLILIYMKLVQTKSNFIKSRVTQKAWNWWKWLTKNRLSGMTIVNGSSIWTLITLSFASGLLGQSS